MASTSDGQEDEHSVDECNAGSVPEEIADGTRSLSSGSTLSDRNTSDAGSARRKRSKPPEKNKEACKAYRKREKRRREELREANSLIEQELGKLTTRINDLQSELSSGPGKDTENKELHRQVSMHRAFTNAAKTMRSECGRNIAENVVNDVLFISNQRSRMRRGEDVFGLEFRYSDSNKRNLIYIDAPQVDSKLEVLGETVFASLLTGYTFEQKHSTNNGSLFYSLLPPGESEPGSCTLLVYHSTPDLVIIARAIEVLHGDEMNPDTCVLGCILQYTDNSNSGGVSALVLGSFPQAGLSSMSVICPSIAGGSLDQIFADDIRKTFSMLHFRDNSRIVTW